MVTGYEGRGPVNPNTHFFIVFLVYTRWVIQEILYLKIVKSLNKHLNFVQNRNLTKHKENIHFYNSERKFEKLPEKYLFQNNNPQVKNKSEIVSSIKKASPLRETRCSEPEKPCSSNRSVKGGNTKSNSCSSKSSHSSKSKSTLSIHSKTSLSKSSSSKSLPNLSLFWSFKYFNVYHLSLNERRKPTEHAQLVANKLRNPLRSNWSF